MRNKKKYYLIIVLLLAIVLFLRVDFAKKEPVFYFSDQKNIEKIFFEFTSRGDTKYYSEIENDYLEIEDDVELEILVNLFKEMKYGFFLPHRPYEYDINISFNDYQKGKYNIKMSKIENKYVFFLNGHRYQNNALTEKIIILMKIND